MGEMYGDISYDLPLLFANNEYIAEEMHDFDTIERLNHSFLGEDILEELLKYG